MVRTFVLAVLGSVLICGTMAVAKPKKPALPREIPMQIFIVTDTKEGCEPKCVQWIAAQGRIDGSSLAVFKKVFRQLGDRKLPILINSGGGHMEAALAIGRLVRARSLDVAVTKTLFPPCESGDVACREGKAKGSRRGSAQPSFAICASACTLILAAGTRRFVGPWDRVGVHQAQRTLINARTKQTISVTDVPKATYRQANKFFIEMGIGEEIMDLSLSTPHDGIRWLTQEELYATRIVTDRMDGDQLLKGVTRPNRGWILTPSPKTQ